MIAPPVMPSVRDLLLDPGADLVEDAVVVERLGDQPAAGDELDQRAQDVGRRLRSTRLMLIGLTPRTIVNIRKPGMLFALSAK